MPCEADTGRSERDDTGLSTRADRTPGSAIAGREVPVGDGAVEERFGEVRGISAEEAPLSILEIRLNVVAIPTSPDGSFATLSGDQRRSPARIGAASRTAVFPLHWALPDHERVGRAIGSAEIEVKLVDPAKVADRSVRSPALQGPRGRAAGPRDPGQRLTVVDDRNPARRLQAQRCDRSRPGLASSSVTVDNGDGPQYPWPTVRFRSS